MPMTEPANAFYAQSGGVTAVINCSACGLLEAARQQNTIGRIYAGKNGIIGALEEELIDTSTATDAAIAALRYMPGGAFGSCRYKLKGIRENRMQYERLIAVFKAYQIRYFFYNGGGDSADTCLKVSQLSASMGYPINAIHIPKTVDNDLPLTDSCPGFGSVAKYVATSVMEASIDLASMAKTSTKVFILEVMGRHAGWIAAAGGLATNNLPLPIIILFPEIPLDKEKLLGKVKAAVEEYGFVSIVVSEGARHKDGSFLADQGSQDAFGHIQLGGVAPVVASMIKQSLGYKFHWAVADYLQRSARHIASGVDVEQAYALGKYALESAIAGKNAVMPAIIRDSDSPYRWHIELADLNQVANIEKKMPADYISSDGFSISQQCRQYLTPLIAGEDHPPYHQGLPNYQFLETTTVPKKLPAFTI